MANVLSMISKITCGHGGVVQQVSTAKLTVGKQPVLLKSSVMGQSIPAKPAPGFCTTADDASHGLVPCTTVTAVDDPPSLATRLTVGGAPVVLATLSGATNGTVGGVTPQKLLAALTSEAKLTAT